MFYPPLIHSQEEPDTLIMYHALSIGKHAEVAIASPYRHTLMFPSDGPNVSKPTLLYNMFPHGEEKLEEKHASQTVRV